MDHRQQTRRPGPIVSPRHHRQPNIHPYPMRPYMPPQSPSPGVSRMPVLYQPVYPPYMPATPSPTPRQPHHHFRQPYLRNGIPPAGGFPPHPGMLNYMRPVIPIAYGIPVMVPFPVYAVPMDTDQAEAEEDDRRERAFPPAGPRLFPHQRAQAGSRSGGGENRGHKNREGTFEVHHPDGTVEVGHDEPLIEELNDEGDERAGHAEGGGGTGDAAVNVTMLRLEHISGSDHNITNENPTLFPSLPAVKQAQPIVIVPERDNDAQDSAGRSGDAASSAATHPQPVRRPQALSGIQAPCHTPEVAPFLPLWPESSCIENAHGKACNPIYPLAVKADIQDGQEVGSGNSIVRIKSRGSSDATSWPVTRPDTFEPYITDGTDMVEDLGDTQQKSRKSQYSDLDPKPSTPVLGFESEGPGRPSSASLPSPEPAQVLDRLLKITGLSARQFMIKLERGEFHMDGEGQGEGHH